MKPTKSSLQAVKSACTAIGIPNIVEIIATSPISQLQPIFVHAFTRRANSRKAPELLRQYEQQNEILGTSSISQHDVYRFALTCQDTAQSAFESVETSPITPLGTNAVLTKISQNNTLSTIRNTEVRSDLTTQLMLECCSRRRRLIATKEDSSVHLCSYGRNLRLQPFDKTKGYMQHFDLFTLSTAGKHKPSEGGFAIPTLRLHIQTLLDVIENLHRTGFFSKEIVVKISDIRFLEQLIDGMELPREQILRNTLNTEFDMFDTYAVPFPKEVDTVESLSESMFKDVKMSSFISRLSYIEREVLIPLRKQYPHIQFCFDFNRKAGIGYYANTCFHIFGKNEADVEFQFADGGVVDWASQFLNNGKEASVISGIGAELMHKLLR